MRSLAVSNERSLRRKPDDAAMTHEVPAMNRETQDWKPALRSDLRLERVGGELILLDGGTERVHELNEVGTFILERCDGERTVGEIVAELVGQYAVSKKRAAQDTEALLEEMKTLGIVN
jgi:hypothetical protein